MGIIVTLSLTLNRHYFSKNWNICCLIYSNLSWLHWTSSILLTATITYCTPKLLSNNECSRVCPPLSNPDSNSPSLADMIKMAQSDYVAPARKLGTKILWPGTSINLMTLCSVSISAYPYSWVFPFLCSLSHESIKYAKYQEFLWYSSASIFNFCS